MESDKSPVELPFRTSSVVAGLKQLLVACMAGINGEGEAEGGAVKKVR